VKWQRHPAADRKSQAASSRFHFLQRQRRLFLKALAIHHGKRNPGGVTKAHSPGFDYFV
jgi:hypothetical protein